MILQAENLSYQCGSNLHLEGISGELAPGSLHFLAGANGSGKSTLLKLLCNYCRPLTGSVRLDGQNIAGIPGIERAKVMGIMWQTAIPALDFSVRELVTVTASVRFPRLGRSSKAQQQKTDEALELFQLNKLSDQRIGTLSGGELQRVMLAGMAALSPEILLLDEPTSALDPAMRNLAMDFLENYARNHTVLMVTHDFELLGRAAGTLWFFDKNRRFYSGKAADMLNSGFLTHIYDAPASVETSASGRKRIYFD